METTGQALLRVEGLRVSFTTYAGRVQAVRGVSFDLHRGEVLAIVGESGCGKSVTAQTILRLNDPEHCHIEAGKVFLGESSLLSYSERQMQKVRSGNISMIFQDPMTSLNPTKRIGEQIVEGLRKHQKIARQQAWEEAKRMMDLVGIANAEKRMRQYPHEFSGGMRQRVMIAMALVCNPQVLIADEPTTALDVTIQAQIIDLMLELRKTLATAILIITHDMGVVADIADRVAIMYAGVIVEEGAVREIFYQPKHPYTWGLLLSIPKSGVQSSQRLIPIDGAPPDLLAPPEGCPFAPRCEYAMVICHQQMPEETSCGANHMVKCWLTHPLAPRVERPEMPKDHREGVTA